MKAFSVDFSSYGQPQHRVVYAEDEIHAALTVWRSTWAPIILIDVKPITPRPRKAPDWTPEA